MRLWIEPSAIEEIASLPGNMRQRVRRAIQDLLHQPRPAQSKPLAIPDELQSEGIEVHRLRLEQWRVIYVIDAELEMITVLAVRRRPPYTYDDLQDLLRSL
jgi:mRNA interferase RelE/StbE